MKDVKDAIIEDNEFEKKVTNCVKKICEVEIYPENELNMASFRDRVVDYFKKKNEVIEKVIRCDIEKDGQRLRLVTLVNIRNGWTGSFNSPENNYSDLNGIRRILHGCKDLANCGVPQDEGLE